MTTVHDAAPFTASLLIVVFVVIIFFTVMQLFVSLILGALQDAKLTEELKQARQWQELVDRTHEFMVTMSTTFMLEERLREFVPGLYYRYRRMKQRRYEHEMRREEAYEERQAKDLGGRQPLPLGAASPSWGRIKVNQGVMVQNVGEDSGSEPDLGPLHNKAQLRAVEDHGRLGSSSSLGSADSGPKGPKATEEEVVDLVVESTRYIVGGVVERTGAAKSLLVTEMSEASDILRNITTVVEVLNKRARDLEMQQQQFTRHF